MQLDEAEWIDRVLKDDDRHAFRQLVLNHQSALRVFLRRILSDDGLADDCAQETWIVVYQKLSSFKGGSFKAWILTIGSRKAFRIKAKQGRFDLLENDDDVEGPTKPFGLKIDLEMALAELSLAQRSCLHLSACEEMSHEEIAAILDIPLGTVKSHLNRAKDRIKKLLTADDERKEKTDAR